MKRQHRAEGTRRSGDPLRVARRRCRQRSRATRWLACTLVVTLALGPTAAIAGRRTPRGLLGQSEGVLVRMDKSGHTWIYQSEAAARTQWNGLPSKVVIHQPDTSSRHHMDSRSTEGTVFNGRLTSNGVVILTDAQGVAIGSDAQIEAARFVAAGGTLSWHDLVAGNEHFTSLSGDVDNAGQIRAGSVALIGRHVGNSGLIVAEDSVVMLAGDEAWIREQGSPVVIRVPVPTDDAPTDSEAAPPSALGAGDALALSLDHTGITRAQEIHFDAGEGGIARVSGELDASDRTAGGVGGEIQVLGEVVGLIDATLDASGDAGGGTIRVGGDYQGGGDLRTARSTYIDADSAVRADALADGDGGTLVVWSDDTTVSRGTLSAHGGAQGGDGGFAEVSGKRHLDLPELPDLRAPNGQGGDLLLDPNNITIVQDVQLDPDDPANLDSAFERLDREFIDNNPNAFIQPNTDDSQISATKIQESLAKGVSIRIITDTFLDAAGEEGTQDGDIVMEAPLTFLETDAISPNTDVQFVLSAANDITLTSDASIVNESEDLTLEILLLANDSRRTDNPDQDDPGFQGDLTIEAEIDSGGGDVELTGWNVEISQPISTGGGDLVINANPELLQGGSVSIRSDGGPANGGIDTDGGRLSIHAEAVEANPDAADPEDRITTPSILVEGFVDTCAAGGCAEGGGGDIDITSVGADVRVTGPIASGGGDMTIGAIPIRVAYEIGEAEDGEAILQNVDRGLEVEVTGGIASGGGDINIAGVDLTIGSTLLLPLISSGGGTIFIDDSINPDFAPDAVIKLDASIASGGGDIFIGDGTAFAGRLEVGLDDQSTTLDASDTSDLDESGSVIISLRDDFVGGNDVIIKGDQILIHAAAEGSAADGNQAQLQLDQGDPELYGRRITLRAGDGYTPDPLPSLDEDGSATVDAEAHRVATVELSDTIVIGSLDEASQPDEFSLAQDADLDDAGIPDASRFVGGSVAGMAYPLESSDGTLSLATFEKVEGSQLTLADKSGTFFAAAPTQPSLDVESIRLIGAEDVTVDATLASRLDGSPQIAIESGLFSQMELRNSDDEITQVGIAGELLLAANVVLGTAGADPDQTLALRGGSNGYGDLVIEENVVLTSHEIALRAGDGTTFDDSTSTEAQEAARRIARVRLHETVQFAAPGGVALDSFTVRQDASISDEDPSPPPVDPRDDLVLPEATQFGAAGLPTEYTIRSDDGSVTLFDASKVLDTDLTLVAFSDIDLEEVTRVRSIDVGGILDYQVIPELLSQIQFTDPADSSITLRAGLDSVEPGNLTFANGVDVNASEIHLVAGPMDTRIDSSDALTSTIVYNDTTRFYGPTGEGSTPSVFEMRIPGVISELSLPSADNFQNTAGAPPVGTFALRSDNEAISFQAIEMPAEYDGLILSADEIRIGRTTTDTDVVLPDELLEFRTDTLELNAFDTTDEDGVSTAVVDFSSLDLLTAFDDGVSDDGVSDDGVSDDGSYDPTFDLDTPPDEAPARLQVVQDGTFVAADQLPPPGSLGPPGIGLTGTEVEIRSVNGGIDLSDPGVTASFANSRLELRVLNDNGTIVFPAILDLENLLAQVDGAWQVNTTTLSAERRLDLLSGLSGSGDLTFENSVALRGNWIGLGAGDGFDPDDYPLDFDDPDAEFPDLPVVDADQNVTFTFTEYVPSAEEGGDPIPPVFAIAQDADIEADDLPDATQMSFVLPAGELETYFATSREGLVTQDPDTGALETRGTIAFEEYESQYSSFPTETLSLTASIAQISDSGGSLQFGEGDPNAPDLVLAANTVELSAPNGQVLADTDHLELLGDRRLAAFPDVSPANFLLRQATAITDANLPRREQFGGGTSEVNYALTSNDAGIDTGTGDVNDPQSFAGKVWNSDLLLVSGGGAPIQLRADLELNSLQAVTGGAPGDGAIEISSSSIQTIGSGFGLLGLPALDQRYLGRVELQGAATTFSGIGIEFASSVDGGADLEVVGSQRVIFRRDVGTGGSGPVASLDAVSGPASDETRPGLFTIEFGGESDAFDFAGFDIDDVSSGVTLPDPTAAPAVEVYASGAIELNRTNDSGIPMRSKIPDAATITQPAGDLTFRTDLDSAPDEFAFAVGNREKITAAGNLQILAPNGRIHVVDLTALDILAVAEQIEFRLRQPGDVRVAGGGSVEDAGVDVVANHIDIQGEITTVGAGRDLVFGLQDPRVVPSFLTDTDGKALYAVATAKEDSTALEVGDLVNAVGRVLDYVPSGASRADLSGEIPDEVLRSPDVTSPWVLAIWNRGILGQVGVEARPPRVEEYRRRLVGAGIFDDVGAVPLQSGSLPVVDARLSAGEGETVVHLFDEIFGPNGSQADEVRDTLQSIVDEYRSDTGARQIYGFELRRYVRNRPNSRFEAYSLLEQLDALFRHHRRLGLAPGEYRRIQRKWLTAIVPDGISLDELSETIHPSRYVRGSDILDIFGD